MCTQGSSKALGLGEHGVWSANDLLLIWDLQCSYQALCIKIACRTVAHSYSRRSLEASLGAASLAPQAASLAASAVGSQPDLCSAEEILTDLPVCIPVKHMGGSCSR